MELALLLFICFASGVIVMRGIRGKNLSDGRDGDSSPSSDNSAGYFGDSFNNCFGGDSGGGDCGGD
ncbi:MAG: hypothetical protein R3D71_01555 [Rickettsiales bacterium]